MNETPIPELLSPQLWMAQEYKAGKLMSVEGFFQHGKTTFLGISGRGKIGKTESRITFPDDEHVTLTARLHMQAACRALLERARIGSAYFHIEFMVDGDNAFVIDANVGRIGEEELPRTSPSPKYQSR